MADYLPLAARPNLDQYRKLAKDFQRACQSGTPDAVRAWAAAWLARKADTDPGDVDRILRTWEGLTKQRQTLADCALADAQFFIARVHGFASWPEFAKHVEALAHQYLGTVT